jgi:hypothetical protein
MMIILTHAETVIYRDGLDGAHVIESDIIDYLSWKNLHDFVEVVTDDGELAFLACNGEVIEL